MVGVVGLDACKERWVALRLADGSFAGASVHPTLAEVVRHHQRCVIIAIDIPIGLPGAVMWIRPADVEARRFVGPRRSSVFMTLPKVVLDAPSHQAAIRVCQAHNEAKISAQAYALKVRIFEADLVAADDGRIYEVHPEVSFREMAGVELEHSKRTWSGLAQRLELLERHGIAIPSRLGDAGAASPDDVLDAAAAAWSANRIALKAAQTLPGEGAPYAHGRIWY